MPPKVAKPSPRRMPRPTGSAAARGTNCTLPRETTDERTGRRSGMGHDPVCPGEHNPHHEYGTNTAFSTRTLSPTLKAGSVG